MASSVVADRWDTLLQQGYLEFEKGVIVLTARGRAAIASAAKS